MHRAADPLRGDMPLAPGYRFVIAQTDGEIRVELTQQATDRSIVFRQRHGCIENVTRHMRSLTDTQCADWFKGQRTQKKKTEGA